MQDHPLTAERDADVALPGMSWLKFGALFLASTLGWTVIFIVGAIVALTMRGA